MKKTLAPIFLLLIPLLCWGQNEKLDSLLIEYEQATNDSAKWHNALNILAQYFYNRNFEEAHRYGEESLIHARKSGNKKLVASSLRNIGTVYMKEEKYDKALEYLLESVDVARESGASKNLAFSLTNLSLIYSYREDYETALSFLYQAKQIAVAEKDTARLSGAYNNIGFAHFQNMQFDSALFYFKKDLDLVRVFGDKVGVALSLGNIGAAYIEKQEFEKAKPYILESIQLKKELNRIADLVVSYGNLGLIYSEQGQFEKAIEALNQSIEVGKDNGLLVELDATYLSLSETYEKMGDYQKALEVFKTYSEVKDSSVQQLNNERTADIETKYKTKEKEAELAEKNLLIAEQQNRQKNLIILGVVGFLLIVGVFQYLRNRQRLRRKETELAYQLEKTESDKLREMDRLKSNFFANISHEFRTPLTLILSPLTEALEQKDKTISNKYMRIMHRNAHRLLQLVNQLLDLSRLEGGRMTMEVKKGDVNKFLRSIAYSFESMAIRKQIHYTVSVSQEEEIGWFDPDKIEKILSNLLSNAFKFTMEEGTVHLKSEILGAKEEQILQFLVRDTGIGIPSGQVPMIFDRFFSQGSAADGEEMASSGVGLALVKELVDLHNGDIEVESEESKGTVFRVRLPIYRSAFKEEEIRDGGIIKIAAKREASIMEESIELQPVALTENKGKPNILVVEDNPDVRTYIKDQLEEDYQIREAVNGKEGLEWALDNMPELIISDVMMPEMDGIELCKRLKTDERTSHIPVIMLTAKAEVEDRIEGLETGADDYLTKPFNVRELLVRVSNLIEQRKKLKEKIGQQRVLKPKEVPVTSVDEAFLQRVLEAIEENMEEEQFSVVELSQMVGMSRSHLNRKLKALTDRSPNQLIREMRLQRGKQLLAKGAGNASEVAFMVGFSSLAYFSKCFRDYYGHPPSEVIQTKI